MVLPLIAGAIAGIVALAPKVASFVATKVIPKVASTLPKIAVPVAKKVIEKPIQSVAIAGVIAGGGAEIIPKIYKTTKKITQKVVPIITEDKPITSENVQDVLKVAGVGLGLGAVGVGAGLIAKEVLEKKEEKIAETNNFIPSAPQVAQEVIPEKTIQTNEGTPITPETQTISTGKKRYKKHKVKSSPIIRNSVRVVNINHSVGAYNKKYIKVGQLA